MNKSLMGIQEEYIKTIEELEDYLIENETDVIPEEFIERLNINSNEVEEKVDNYRLAINSILSERIAIEIEVKRLEAIKKKKEKTIEYLKQRVFDAVELFGSKNGEKGGLKLKTSKSSVTLIRSSSVVIDDINMIDDMYINVEFNKISADAYVKMTHILFDLGQEAIAQFFLNLIKDRVPDKVAIKKAIEAEELKRGTLLTENDIPLPVNFEGAHIDKVVGYIKFS